MVTPYDKDNHIASIAFTWNQQRMDFDKADTESCIIPFTPSSEPVPWEGGRRGSFEQETDLSKNFTSSSMLMEPPLTHFEMKRPEHAKKKDRESDASSGYLNFGDAHDGSEGIFLANPQHATILSGDELNILDSQSSREGTCSPEPQFLSIGSITPDPDDFTTELHTLPANSDRCEDPHFTTSLIHATNPSFECDKAENTFKLADGNLPLPAEEDSGFPATGSGFSLSKSTNLEGESSGSFLALHEMADIKQASSQTKDSGYPIEDSSSPEGLEGLCHTNMTGDSRYQTELDAELKIQSEMPMLHHQTTDSQGD